MVSRERIEYHTVITTQSETSPIHNFVSFTSNSTLTDFPQRLLCLFNILKPIKTESQIPKKLRKIPF